MVGKGDKDEPAKKAREVEALIPELEQEAPLQAEEVVDIEATQEAKNAQLRARLTECEKEKRSHLEALQRAKADFLNSKRRLEQEQVRYRLRAQEAYIAALLPLCDSFDMAMQNKEAWNACDENWRKGIEGIYSQLQKILSDNGVTALHPEGMKFDPAEHEAVSNQTASTPEKIGAVCAVLQKGYKLGERIIRPAKVAVGVASG